MPCVGEVEGDHRAFEVWVPQVALDEPRIQAGFEPMGGVGMPQGMDGHAGFRDPSTVFGDTEGTLDPGPTHGAIAIGLCCWSRPVAGKSQVVFRGGCQ